MSKKVKAGWWGRASGTAKKMKHFPGSSSLVRGRHITGGGGGGGGGGKLDQPRMSLDLAHLLGDDDLNKPKTERLKKRRRKFIALGVLVTVSAVRLAHGRRRV